MARSLGFFLEDMGKLSYKEALTFHARPGLARMLYAAARFAALVGSADRQDAVAQKGAA